MKTKEQNKKLTHIKALYDAACEAYSETMDAMERSMEQYLGSSEIDGSREGASYVRNITYELIESELSPEIPYARVDTPCYTPRGAEMAEAAERLLKVTMESIPIHEINDADERSTYIFGGSLLFLEWDKEQSDKRHTPIKLRQISPRDFVPEPGVTRVEDMSYCFLRFATTKSELEKKYGLTPEELLKCECGYEYGGSLSGDDTVTVIYAFYKSDEGLVSQFIFSGDVALADIPDYYENNLLGDFVTITEDGKFSVKNQDIANDSLQNKGKIKKKIPVEKYRPKDFPIVLRKNISAEGELLGRSDAEILRPTQQAINKVESRIMQKLMRSCVTPIMPEDAEMTMTNSVFGQVIKIRAGESADSYGTVDTTPDISQDIEEADRLYDQAKRLIGISDAYQGIDYNKVESGYAKQLRINQAQGRLQSKRKMKLMAYERLFRLIVQHFLCFSEGATHLSYKDDFGRVRCCDFSPLGHLSFDQRRGVFYLSDELTFTADNDAGNQLMREVIWERNQNNLAAGTLGDKTKPETLLRYWQLQAHAHYPGSKDNVEYFKMLLDGEKNPEKTPMCDGENPREMLPGKEVTPDKMLPEKGENPGESEATV